MQWTNITTACIVIEIGIYRIKVYVHAASEILFILSLYQPLLQLQVFFIRKFFIRK